MDGLPFRTSEFANSDDSVDRSFGRRLMSSERLSYARDNNVMASNRNILSNSFRLIPVLYDMDDPLKSTAASSASIASVKTDANDTMSHQTDKFDLGTLVLSKIIEQMKSLNTSVNVNTVVYDPQASRRAGLIDYAEFLNETGKDKRNSESKVFGNKRRASKAANNINSNSNSNKIKEKKLRYTLPTYY